MKQASAGGSKSIERGSMRRMLDALPKTTPLTVIRTLEGIFNMGGSQLPPHVFFAAVEQSSVAISISDIQANVLYAKLKFRHSQQSVDAEGIQTARKVFPQNAEST